MYKLSFGNGGRVKILMYNFYAKQFLKELNSRFSNYLCKNTYSHVSNHML